MIWPFSLFETAVMAETLEMPAPDLVVKNVSFLPHIFEVGVITADLLFDNSRKLTIKIYGSINQSYKIGGKDFYGNFYQTIVQPPKIVSCDDAFKEFLKNYAIDKNPIAYVDDIERPTKSILGRVISVEKRDKQPYSKEFQVAYLEE